jgi:hypothetical protein
MSPVPLIDEDRQMIGLAQFANGDLIGNGADHYLYLAGGLPAELTLPGASAVL